MPRDDARWQGDLGNCWLETQTLDFSDFSGSCSLPSAIDFIRAAKSKQLELFDLLVAGAQTSALPSSHQNVLFYPQCGEAIGFALVNVSPQHPVCMHTLLRLSQKDAVALGHKRTSTETLRLLLTHPEVSPVMAMPSAQPYSPHLLGRPTPLSQTPSHRRASILCALCGTQSSDIPGAWKHLSRNPHEVMRKARNASVLQWLASEHPSLFAALMTDREEGNAATAGAAEPAASSRSSSNNSATAMAKVKGGTKHNNQNKVNESSQFPKSGKLQPSKARVAAHEQLETSLNSEAVTNGAQQIWRTAKGFPKHNHQLQANSYDCNTKLLNPEAPAFVPAGCSSSDLSAVLSPYPFQGRQQPRPVADGSVADGNRKRQFPTKLKGQQLGCSRSPRNFDHPSRGENVLGLIAGLPERKRTVEQQQAAAGFSAESMCAAALQH